MEFENQNEGERKRLCGWRHSMGSLLILLSVWIFHASPAKAQVCDLDETCVYCGNENCELGEDFSNCPLDCTPSACGDFRCDSDEDSSSCPDDCPPSVCGDSQCSPDEDANSCPDDCGCTADADCNDHDPCTDDICNSGVCSHPDNTASCDDGNPCTDEDSCHDGQCSGSIIEGCIQCESSEQCNDGLVCNGVETCGDNGTCQPGTPLICEDDGNPCTDDVCSEDAKGCDHPNNEKSCDDGDACTTEDSCHEGVCVPGPMDPKCGPSCGNRTCDDGETCTTCPSDCGECPPGTPGGSTCGNGVCETGEDCNCSDCAEADACLIEAQRLKCVQNLTTQGIDPETANALAAQGICQSELEGQSAIGGCSLTTTRGTSPLVNLVGTLLFFGASAPLFLLRRARQRRG